MKLSQGWSFPHAHLLGLCVMWAAIAMSYFFLSKAVTGIPVGVTFAFWEGLGLTCITLGSVFFLNEPLTLRRALGLACVLSGALLVNYGTGHGPSRRPAKSGVQRPARCPGQRTGQMAAGGLNNTDEASAAFTSDRSLPPLSMPHSHRAGAQEGDR